MEGVRKLYAVAMLVLVALASNHELCGAQTICNLPYTGLLACKPAVTPPNPPKPTDGCCTSLSHADLKCLCSYKNSQLLPSLGIDPNLAMQLPAKCKLPTPVNC